MRDPPPPPLPATTFRDWLARTERFWLARLNELERLLGLDPDRKSPQPKETKDE